MWSRETHRWFKMRRAAQTAENAATAADAAFYDANARLVEAQRAVRAANRELAVAEEMVRLTKERAASARAHAEALAAPIRERDAAIEDAKTARQREREQIRAMRRGQSQREFAREQAHAVERARRRSLKVGMYDAIDAQEAAMTPERFIKTSLFPWGLKNG